MVRDQARRVPSGSIARSVERDEDPHHQGDSSDAQVEVGDKPNEGRDRQGEDGQGDKPNEGQDRQGEDGQGDST